MVQTLLTTAASVLVTLVITLIFNGIINWPKKKRLQQSKEEEERKKFRDDLLSSINKNNEEVKMDLQLCKLGLQAVIKNTLKTRYEKWIVEGYAPLDAKDDLERMYQVYHKLGANGVMDSLREKFLELPDIPPKQHKG